MLHDDGASTDSTGTLVSSMAMIGSLNGSRTSPEKLKPGQCELRDGCWSFGGNTEYGVYHMICSLQRLSEVVGKWHIQVFQLRSQTLVEVVLALLGIEDGRLVSVVPEMASGNEPVPTCVCQLR